MGIGASRARDGAGILPASLAQEGRLQRARTSKMKGRSYETRAERLAGAPAEAHRRRGRVRSLRQDAGGTRDLSRLAGRAAASSGRAALVVLGLLATLALAVWIGMQRFEGDPERPLEPIDAGGAVAGAVPDAPRGSTPSERSAELWDPPKPYERARPTLPTFEGRGSIRGLVQAPPGVALPKSYIVEVGPSLSLTGRERAERRTHEAGAPEFAIEDLPLGGYDVWITSPGMNSRRTPVLLSEASPHPFLVLKISPMGSLDGFVVRADGGPAEELRVELAERDGDGRLETRTRRDGYYLFEDVPDGEYRIGFGPLQAPLLPEREVAFLAPSLRFPKVELPPTADVLIHTTNTQGRAIGEITLTGFGRPAGRLETTSDLSGNAWARNLPPGRYRVSASGDEGLTGKTTLEITDESGQEFWVAVQ